jgi:hypothetical protein
MGEPAPGHQWVEAVVRRSFVWLPFVSLLAHLILMHWVYDAHLHAAYVAPVLLGLAVMLGGATPTKLLKPVDLALLRLVLPALAVVLSLDAPSELRAAPLGAGSRLVLTPVLVSLSLAYVVYISLYLGKYALRLIAGALAAVLVFAFGPTPSQVAAAGQQWAEWTFSLVVNAVVRVVPRTMTGWGLTAVGAAFAFLGLGAYVSLKKTPEPQGQG